MTNVTGKTKRPCWATFPCYYRKNNFCTFWIYIDVILGKFAEGDPENRNCYLGVAKSLQEPCLELDEAERKLGIRNLLESDYQRF